jgi:hypothetical protein
MGQRYTMLAGLDQSGVFGGNALAFTCLRVIHDLRLSATASATQSAATAEWMWGRERLPTAIVAHVAHDALDDGPLLARQEAGYPPRHLGAHRAPTAPLRSRY